MYLRNEGIISAKCKNQLPEDKDVATTYLLHRHSYF